MPDGLLPFGQPLAAEFVLCCFPEDLRRPRPGPQERPAIILQVHEPLPEEASFRVLLCYGSSNRGRLYPHEFEITKAGHPNEFAAAGLSFDTKFDLRQQMTLPYTSEWFKLPARRPYGVSPKIGMLHPWSVPRLVRAARAAWL